MLLEKYLKRFYNIITIQHYNIMIVEIVIGVALYVSIISQLDKSTRIKCK